MLTRDQREVEDRLRCYLAGLADGQTLAGYCAAKGENTLLREVIRELRGLNYQTVQTESHSNPFLHFVREHTVVLDDQEQEGALATTELVAAYLVTHPNTHRSERSLQMCSSTPP